MINMGYTWGERDEHETIYYTYNSYRKQRFSSWRSKRIKNTKLNLRRPNNEGRVFLKLFFVKQLLHLGINITICLLKIKYTKLKLVQMNESYSFTNWLHKICCSHLKRIYPVFFFFLSSLDIIYMEMEKKKEERLVWFKFDIELRHDVSIMSMHNCECNKNCVHTYQCTLLEIVFFYSKFMK